MKILLPVFLLSLLLQFSDLKADIIPDDSHYVEKCCLITNIDEFENLVLLGYVTFFNEHENTYQISGENCLTKGYKMNELSIFAVHKNHIKDKNIEDIDFPNDNNALIANIQIEPYIGYVSNDNPIVAINEFYKVLGFKNNELILFKWKQITEYNNGEDDLEETFTYNGDISEFNQEIILSVATKASNFNIFPNPATNFINIENFNSSNKNIEITIMSVCGVINRKFTFSNNNSNKNITIPTKNFPQGVYIVEVNNGSFSKSQKVLIN